MTRHRESQFGGAFQTMLGEEVADGFNRTLE